jgi:hypothetical protein
MATAMATAATMPIMSKERPSGKPTFRRRSLLRLATRPVTGTAGRSGQLRSGGRATRRSSATGAGTSLVAGASDSPAAGASDSPAAGASDSPAAGAGESRGSPEAVSGAGPTATVGAPGLKAAPAAACARPRRRRLRLGGGSSVSAAIRSMAAASSFGLRCGALTPARLRLGAIEPHDRPPDSKIAPFGGWRGERSGQASRPAEGAAIRVQTGALGVMALLLSPKGREDGI